LRFIALVLIGVAVAGCPSTIAPQDGSDVDAALDSNAGDSASDMSVTDNPPPADAQLCGFGDGAAFCAPGQACLTCSAGPQTSFACVTLCTTGAECRDPGQSSCVRGGCNSLQYCSAASTGCGCGICAAEHTLVATPSGEREISAIEVGDPVYGMRDGQLVPVRVLRATRTRVWNHTMVRVTLRSGRAVEMSAGHPTVAGGRFGGLATGDDLGGGTIVRTDVVPYAGSHTYDLLTDGDQGAYVASGVIVGSTWWQPAGCN